MSGPGRPFTVRSTEQLLDGAPSYLGVLVSTGTAVNNFTTATPFNATPLGPGNFINTLAGKVLMFQGSAAGFVLPGATTAITITNQTLPTGAGLAPGASILAGERLIVIMPQASGWLQWLPSSGSANLFVWELL